MSDTRAWEALQRLARCGLVPALKVESRPDGDAAAEAQRRTHARQLMEGAQRKLKMAEVLRAGGFAVEAMAPAREGVETAIRAAAIGGGLLGADDAAPVPESLLHGELLARGWLRSEDVGLVTQLRHKGDGAVLTDARLAERLIEGSGALLHRLAE